VGESLRATKLKRGPAFGEAALGSAPDVDVVQPEASRTTVAAMPQPLHDPIVMSAGNYDGVHQRPSAPA
jgi:hypothetical protein